METDMVSVSDPKPDYRTIRVDAPPPESDFSPYYKWRFESEIISYIDLAFGTLNIMGCLIATTLMVYVTVNMKRGYLDKEIQESFPGLEPDNENVYLGTIFAETFAWLVVSLIHLWAANVLRIGTTIKELKPYEKAKKCAVWRNFAILLLLLTIGIFVAKLYANYLFWLWIKVRHQGSKKVTIQDMTCHHYITGHDMSSFRLIRLIYLRFFLMC